MPARNTVTQYGNVAQTLHWVVVALVVTQFTLAYVAKNLPLGPDKVGILARHKSVGITILAIAVLRLAWRFFDRPPPPPPMPGWQAIAARVSHASLYGLLFAMPLIGWMMSSASNYPVSWFGVVQLPDLVSPDADLKQSLRETHVLLSKVLIAIASLHVLAALKHQFLDHDGLLFRMLPWRSR
ncbi:MAG: cytochrome b [Steroidobacteraceae bacterium]